MIYDMILPQLGMGMSEGTPVNWMIAEGGRAERDRPVVEIETEKVTTELPAPYSGFLHIVVQSGTTVSIETTIAKIAETHEEYQQLVSGSVNAERVETPASDTAGFEPLASESSFPKPIEAQPSGRPRISGLAKKLAEEHAISLESITGTGPGGRIVREDVLAAIDAVAHSTANTLAPSTQGETRELARVPIEGIRKVIAQRTAKSKITAAHTYVFFDIDVTNLVAAQKKRPIEVMSSVVECPWSRTFAALSRWPVNTLQYAMRHWWATKSSCGKA